MNVGGGVAHHHITPLPAACMSPGERRRDAAAARHFFLAQQARLAAQLEVRTAEAAAVVEHRYVRVCCLLYVYIYLCVCVCVYVYDFKKGGRRAVSLMVLWWRGTGLVGGWLWYYRLIMTTTTSHTRTHTQNQRQGQHPPGAGPDDAPRLLPGGAHAPRRGLLDVFGPPRRAVRDVVI